MQVLIPTLISNQGLRQIAFSTRWLFLHLFTSFADCSDVVSISLGLESRQQWFGWGFTSQSGITVSVRNGSYFHIYLPVSLIAVTLSLFYSFRTRTTPAPIRMVIHVVSNQGLGQIVLSTRLSFLPVLLITLTLV
jgi:hypothetical protein